MTDDTSLDEETVALLADLVSIESYSGAESAIQERIVHWFAAQGIEAGLEEADDGLINVVVEIGDGGGGTLLLCGHCDTVGAGTGWTKPPHRPAVEGNRLYGLGAMDMKAGLAAAMVATRSLHRMRHRWHGKLLFASLADEEALSRGANAFVRKDRGIDAAIICEPHFEDVVIGAMGKIGIEVEVSGRSAHGSRPEAGINAVTEAARLVVALDGLQRASHPRFGAASHCVLDMSSGDGKREIRVPDRCGFTINWHFMPGETADEAVATVERLAADLSSPAVFLVTATEPRYESYWLGPDHPFVTAFGIAYRDAIGAEPALAFGRGVSDANIMCGRADIPTILFGPSGANMHAVDEWADLDQLRSARRLYTDFALTFLTSFDERRLP